jgi:hypothetical protein
MARNLQEAESRRSEASKATIEAARDAKIDGSKEEMESQVRRIRAASRRSRVSCPDTRVRLGIFIFMRRQKREREGAAATRDAAHQQQSTMTEMRKTWPLPARRWCWQYWRLRPTRQKGAGRVLRSRSDFFLDFNDPNAGRTRKSSIGTSDR